MWYNNCITKERKMGEMVQYSTVIFATAIICLIAIFYFISTCIKTKTAKNILLKK